jgi:hypothetical protein
MTHLKNDELVDAVEGLLAARRQAHLAECDTCRRRLAELSGVLGEAKQASVPEPSPLFWPHFSTRVRAAIDQEPLPDSPWPAWLRWQVLLPLGAAAMVILALMMAVPKQEPGDEGDVAALDDALSPSLAGDASWSAVVAVVGELDLDVASAAGVIAQGVAEQAVLELTAEEQQELTRLLKAELTRAKS